MGGEGETVSGIWPLVLSAAALMGSPGPSTISVTAVGAAFGARRALGYLAGLVLATTAVLLVVASGMLALALAVPGVVPVVTVLSAAYILYLAVRIASAPPLAARDAAAPAPSLGAGLLLGIGNPKAWVAIAAVFAGSRLEGLSPGQAAVAKTAVLAAMIVVIHLVWLLLGASLARWLRNPVASRAVNLVLAAVLAGSCALALLR